MKKLILATALSAVTLSLPSASLAGAASQGTPLTQYVNPYIGTGGHGHVFLGANVPFGLVQTGPTQHTRGWDWCSGYHYSDSVLIGFGTMHLSGTGVGDLGDVSLLPVLAPDEREVLFSHRAERVRPGYYAVTLDGGIRAEMTATERTALHRYTLPADATEGYVVLNLRQGIGWDKTTEAQIQVDGPTTVSGYRFSRGWAKRQKVFFVAEFSRPVSLHEQRGDTIGVFRFAANDAPLLVRIGLSPVSIDGARANLRAELDTWDFAATVRQADTKWNEQLRKVNLSGASDDERTIFYTALYHTMTAPSVFCDVDGSYRGADDAVHHASHTTYTTLSLWDTYRAAHPLMTLLHPERQADIAATFINIYKEQGKLPVWHLMGNETDCMVGNPAIPVVADLVMKGYAAAGDVYEAMKGSAMLDERGLDLMKQYGYLPFDLHQEGETVAKTLEYALADWCVARVAERMGQRKDRQYFDRRAQAYRRLFDPATRFMRGLDSEGRFREPFDPFHSIHRQNDYTEGNAWQYTWLVPHDVHGLIGLFGSEQRFVEKLDSLFIAEGDLGEDASPDISGLIGQYAHGNEPSHHIIYLYNYAGQPWRTAQLLQRTMREMYHNAPDGLSGNEDVGQMSAWYILSALGFYQVEPAGGKYVIGSPLFPEATISVGGGRTFTVKALNRSGENIYVQRIRLNGQPYTRSYIMFRDIMQGGTMEVEMGPEPSDFGTRKKDRP